MRTKTQVLQKAKKIILERGWCQGNLEDDNGKVCAIGALNAAQAGNHFYDVQAALAKAIYPKFDRENDDSEEIVVGYNDSDKRRRYQVVAKFDKAIDLLKRGKI